MIASLFVLVANFGKTATTSWVKMLSKAVFRADQNYLKQRSNPQPGGNPIPAAR